jgi:hypothetical protein
MTSPAGTSLSCRVVVFAAPDEPEDLGQILERSLGMHATDALVLARTAPGVLAIPLSRAQADEIASGIAAIGVQAAVITIDELPPFDHAVEVLHHVQCLDEGLRIIELHGREATLIPWSGIDLISAGQVPQESARHDISGQTAAVRAARRTGPSPMKTPLSPGPEVWILLRSPARWLRIDHKRMNYEYLGDRKTDSATSNFRLFLDDLVARAREAYVTPATRAFLTHGSVADYSFTTVEDLQRATHLHLLIHRRAGAAPAV